jgi:hypothetical protein
MSFITIAVYGQDDDEDRKTPIKLLQREHDWYQGTVVLNDQTQIKGLVRYNDRDGFISFDDGNEVRIFTAKNMLQVSFHDTKASKQRTLYSLPFKEDKKSEKAYVIFEVLKEYKDFVVLLRIDPIEANTAGGAGTPVYTSSGMPTGTTVGGGQGVTQIFQLETVYLLGANGEAMPYLKLIHSEDGFKSSSTGEDRKTKGKIRDKELLAEFIGQSAYEKLIAYAKEKDLSFKNKEDLMTILNYYDSIKDER